MEQIYDIPLKRIHVSNWNVRLTDRNKDIEDLAESIKKHNQLQPIVLMGEYEDGNRKFEIIVGQRRFLATKILGRDKIRAIFKKPNDEVQATIWSLAENMHRVDLNHADKAEAITKLFLHYDKDAKKVARELGISVSTVREYVNIEELATQKAKRLLKSRKISKIDVKRVIEASQGDRDKADKILDEMNNLSKYDKIRLVEYGSKNPKASARDILNEAKKPKITPQVTLSLSKEMNEALELAKNTLSIGREDIAVKALTEWLEKNGFLK